MGAHECPVSNALSNFALPNRIRVETAQGSTVRLHALERLRLSIPTYPSSFVSRA
jgi:hypothetical protein